MIDGYKVLAPVYDKLNGDVDYVKWADFIEECFKRFSAKKIESVLDMGCGTGSMTMELARRNYDMTGLDISEDMLSVAEQTSRETGLKNILYIFGDMCSFELYGTVDAVICCLDGINHITKREDLRACFALVSNYLNPDGLFVFDVNTPHKFKTQYADHDYILEEDGVVCCWRNRLSKKKDTVDFYLTVFKEDEDGNWKRHDGAERERSYGIKAIKNALEEAGLIFCSVFAGYGFEEINDDTDRWYIVAKKK